MRIGWMPPRHDRLQSGHAAVVFEHRIVAVHRDCERAARRQPASKPHAGQTRDAQVIVRHPIHCAAPRNASDVQTDATHPMT